MQETDSSADRHYHQQHNQDSPNGSQNQLIHTETRTRMTHSSTEALSQALAAPSQTP
jgi:hypothetical protein